MKKSYVLMNKELPLVSFNLNNIASDSFELSDLTVHNDSPYNAKRPLNLLLHHRLPDKKREHMDQLPEFAEINCVSDFFDISYGLSLNDTLWVRPIVDNGEGLLPYYTVDKDIDEYSKKYDIRNFGLSFEGVTGYCLENRHKKMLARLDGFKFPADPLFDLPAERIERIEALLQKRIRWLCGLEVHI